MSIASDLIRGNTEMIILAHLLDGDSYGYKINKAISQKTDGGFELKEATLYTAFRRLEEAGCVTTVGKQTMGKGRPARVMKILLPEGILEEAEQPDGSGAE